MYFRGNIGNSSEFTLKMGLIGVAATESNVSECHVTRGQEFCRFAHPRLPENRGKAAILGRKMALKTAWGERQLIRRIPDSPATGDI
tara:strand:+ start:1010 stop:1270 length:261 start_codon:yes stop_codon:yes gene_type:complete